MDKAPGYTWAYSVVVDKMEAKEEVVDKLLCMSCLCVGRKLHTVKDQRMQQYYLQTLNEIPLCNMPQVCPNICWECMALLRKAVSFREQVKDSFRILQTYTNETFHECLLTDITRPPRMTVVSLDPVSILPSSAIDDDDKCSDDDKRCDDKPAALDVQQVYVKEEVKTEWSDVLEEADPTDYDRPPSDCKDSIEEEEIDIATLIRKKDKKKKKPPKQPEPQKILTIELSYEEMLVERASEATRESYLMAKHKCDTCLIGFTNIRSHESHMASKHSSELGDSSCPICKTVMSSVEAFTAHYKRHMRRYECSICHKRTMDIKVMQQHYYSAHEISLKEYKCNLCGKISNSIDTHRYHKDTHKARVECPDCDKTFTHRAGLMNHRLAVHELHNAFPCAECGKVFRWKTSLKRHLEKHDVKRSASSGAFCSVCEIAFSSVSSLQRHLRSSLKHVTTDDLRFICDHCNRRFADKTKLRDHIEEKHLHRTFQCPICLKPSKNRVGLDQHIRNVHKGRPNNKICHHCGKGFPTRVQLESHIRTHTGERPFICEYCPTTFSQQSNLYKHFRQVHLNIKSKRYPLSKKTEPPPTERVPPSLHFSPERGFLL